MAKTNEIIMDRRTDERRKADGRRTDSKPVSEENRKTPRRKVQRRRQIDPTTCERDYSQDEIEFMHALDDYKRANGRMFPTCSEILEVVRGLGYVRLAPEELALVWSDDDADNEVDDEFDSEIDNEDDAADL